MATAKREARIDRLEAAFLRLEESNGRLESLQTQTTNAIVSLERGQAEGNVRLGRIDDTLRVASRLFELMNERLESLEEGQQTLVEGQHELVGGQRALVEGQQALVERLDRLVDVSTRDRTIHVERLAKLELRVEALEKG